MTEGEWLASEDPWLMLEWIRLGNVAADDDYPPNYPHCPVVVSDRQLRLFACACCYGFSADLGRDAEVLMEEEAGLACDPKGWARAWAGDQCKPTTAERAALLREIVGNPFRLVRLWLTPTVVALAKAAYEERQACPNIHDVSPVRRLVCQRCHDTRTTGLLDPDRLAVLADALEDAGCSDTQILSHLRGPGPHVRGCWVIDLLMG